MPRAPHSSALLAGRPWAKRSVFSTRRSRTRSMPLSSDMSTRLTRRTGASSRPSGYQTKASAAAKSGAGGGGGARRSSASAIRASSSALPSAGGAALALRGRCCRLPYRRLSSCERARRFGHVVHRVAAFPLAGRERLASAAGRRGVAQRCNWANGGYSPRRFCAQNRPFRPRGRPRLTAALGGAMLITPAFAQGMPFGLWRRQRRHDHVVHAADLDHRDYVFPGAAAAAAAR